MNQTQSTVDSQERSQGVRWSGLVAVMWQSTVKLVIEAPGLY